MSSAATSSAAATTAVTAAAVAAAARSSRAAGGAEQRTAIVGRLGGAWGVLVVEPMGEAVRVVAQANGRDLIGRESGGRESGGDEGIASAITLHKAKRVLTVVPAHESTARTLVLPADAAVDRVAVAMFGEAHATAGAASHRAGAGLLRSSGAAPSLLVASWLGDEQSPAWLAKLASSKLVESCTTPAAGIAALLAIGASDAIAYSDGDCIIAAARGTKGASVRAVVEDDDGEGWPQAVRDVLAGLVKQVEGDESDIKQPQRAGKACVTSIDDGKLQRVVSGAPRDAAWRGELLPLLGAAALLAWKGVGEDLGGLATLSRREPVPEVPAVVKVGAWAGRTRVWPLLLGVAALLLIGAPIGLTQVRARLAESKAKQLDAAREKTKDLELKAAVHAQLETARWPLSKMVADISGAAPVGVSVKSLRMTVGQPLSIQGEAKDAAQVNELQEALATAGYRNIKQNRVSRKPSGEGVEFDVSAEAGSVHLPVTAKEDFAAAPLAVRLYGEGASNTTMPVGAVKQVRKTAGTRTPSASGGSDKAGDGKGGDAKAADTTRRPTEAPSSEPPAELKDEDIAKLTSGEAMKGWTTRRTYLSRNAGIDAGLKARLEEEIKKLQEQQRKANTSSASTEKKEGAK